jgi:hypothetical protein
VIKDFEAGDMVIAGPCETHVEPTAAAVQAQTSQAVGLCLRHETFGLKNGGVGLMDDAQLAGSGQRRLGPAA